MMFNRKTIIMIVCALAIVLVGVTLVAAQDEGEKIAITGTVEQTDAGLVIMGDDGEQYNVTGRDLSAMVGKDVEAIGTVTENEGVKTLRLLTVKELE